MRAELPPLESVELRWHLGFWLAVAVAATATLVGLHALGMALHPSQVRWLGARADHFEHGLEQLVLSRDAGYVPALVYLGDSTVSEYEPDAKLARLTTAMLRRRHGFERAYVADLSSPGSGVDQYAFFTDRIADVRPDLVIWQLSLFHFTDHWTARNGAPELVGFVDAGRVRDVLGLAYERLGLRLDDILLQQAIVHLGLHATHREIRRSQLRFSSLRERLEEWLNPNRGRRPEQRALEIRRLRTLLDHVDEERPGRYSAKGERLQFESTLEGLDPNDVRLGLLRSGIDSLRRRDIDVLGYMNPTNLDNLRRVGVYDEDAIATTLDRIRTAVEESGAHWLDLHALLGDADFSDAAGHMVDDETHAVPLRVASEVAAAAGAILQDRRGRTGMAPAAPGTGSGTDEAGRARDAAHGRGDAS